MKLTFLTLDSSKDMRFSILKLCIAPTGENKTHAIGRCLITNHMNAEYGMVLFQALSYRVRI